MSTPFAASALNRFLQLSLDQDYAVAIAAQNDTSGVWSYRPPDQHPARVYKVYDDLGYSLTEGDDIDSSPWWTAEHIALWDPATVLQLITVHRQILSLHRVNVKQVLTSDRPIIHPPVSDWPAAIDHVLYTAYYWCGICDQDKDYGYISSTTEGCDTLRSLASLYSKRPNYKQEWALTLS